MDNTKTIKEELREEFKNFSTIVSVEVIRNPSKDIEKMIADFWLSHLDKISEIEYNRGYEQGKKDSALE